MQDIHMIDYSIFAIIAVSTLMGLMRGFVREAISLATWITAISVVILHGETVAGWFNGVSTISWVRSALAFVLLVLSILIIGGMLSHLISKIIRSTHFSITDRIIGILFGFARGVVVIALAITLIRASGIPYDSLARKSILIPKLEPATEWLETKFPDDLKKMHPHIKKDDVINGAKDSVSELLKLPSQKLDSQQQEEESMKKELQQLGQETQKLDQTITTEQKKSESNDNNI